MDPTDGSSGSATETSTAGSTMGSGATSQGSATSASTTESTTQGGTETGDPSCPEPHRCIDAIPEDWAGPVAKTTQLFGSEPALCTAPYAAPAVTLYADPLGTPATCTCACSSPSGAACSATLRQDFSAGCNTGIADEWTMPLGMCVEISGGGITGYFQATPDAAVGGNCNPYLQDPVTTEPAWDTRATACSPLEIDASACGDQQLCAPPPPEGFDESLCIYRQGDVECPVGTSYSERTVLYGDFTDTRDCVDDCECDAPVDVTCSGVVLLSSTTECGSIVGGVTVDGTTCYDHQNPPVRSASYEGGPQGGSCNPSGGTPIGEVTGDAPVTFCCG
jgi:hypothetical protein